MVLKHWILSIDHLKTHLFFPKGVLKPCREAIWQVSEDRYHTEFVSERVDHFLFKKKLKMIDA